MKLTLLIKMILFCFTILLASCAYTTKLSDKLLPDSEYNTLVVKADAAMHDAEWLKAADFYEKAGQLKPENWDLKLKQANAFQNAGKLAQAFNTYQIIIDAKSSAADANDTTLKSAKENQRKLGFKSEVTAPQADLPKQVEPAKDVPVSISNKQADEAPIQEVVGEGAKEVLTITEQAVPKDQKVTQVAEQLESAVTENQLILDAVNAWAGAWSAKKLDAYFAHYVEGFAGDMANAKTWRLSRKNKILHSKQIKIALSEVKMNQRENVIEVVFKQSYQSGNYQDVGRKTLEMTKVNGRWLIKKELFN